MLRMIDPVMGKMGINGEVRDERIKSYLRGSVPVQKSWVKPAGLSRGGRSQCVSAMGRNEGAGPRYSGGWRFGLIDARVPAPTAKRISGFLAADLGGLRRLLLRAFRVPRVATWRKRSVIRTIEDPRCSRSRGITERYKAVPKSVPDAAARVTCFLRRTAQGSQLDQSSRPLFTGRSMKGRSSGSRPWPRCHEIVSSPAQAAFGPGRASSRLNPLQAKQHPAPAAFLPRLTISPQTGPKTSR